MSVTTEEQICNIALFHLGEAEISNISGTDTTSTILEEVYDQNRDFVMEEFPWPSVTKRTSLALAAEISITDISSAKPGVVTCSAHTFINNDLVIFSGCAAAGLTDMDGNVFRVSGKTDDTFELEESDGDDVDTTGYGTYTSGGSVRRYATSEWDYVYDLPDDCLKPLKILDELWEEDTEYEWKREGSLIYCNIEDAALKYTKKETDPANYSSALTEAIAYRLGWLVSIPITGSKELKNNLWTMYDRFMRKTRGSSAEGGASQDQGEALWINAR